MTGSPPRAVLRLGAGAVTTAIAGCVSGGGTEGTSPTATDAVESSDTPTPTKTATANAASWREVELTDIQTGNSFTISQFEVRPVLLEFFAVWCPVCTDQQKVLRDVTDRKDDLVVISLNTDTRTRTPIGCGATSRSTTGSTGGTRWPRAR
jgi:cytochrome oxidase Cu insertion factor (SCO1/SenC/PrrC family)